ncbi:MAG TPA: Wzz/FepE/Etk N-terminal domain-containing protein, partial [Sphingobacteriaceae bacterium]
MNQQMISIYPASEEKGNHTHSSNIMNVIRQYAYHWPLFCITILSALALAFIYLEMVAPVYEVKARLLIKDQIRGVSAAEPALAELDFIRANHLVENELEILKSRALMDKVVRDLQIWVTYKKKDKILERDLYKNSPVHLVFVQGDPEEITPRKLKVKILNSMQYALVDGEKITRMNFSSRLKLGGNYYRLEATNHLPDYAGSEISISIISPKAATGLYLAKLITSPVSKVASLVEISLKDDVPERGKDILDKLIAEYNQASVEYKNRETQNTLKFMDARLDSLSDELGTLEKNVAGFKSSRGLTEISEKSKLFLDNVRSNDEKLNEVNVQLEVIADLENYISTGDPETSPSTNGISDPNLAVLLEQLTTLELQRNRLLATMPEKNPVVQAVDNQIKTLRVTIKDNIRSIKSSLMATRKQLRSYDSSFEASIRDIPVQERQYISIKREQSIKEDLYIYLLRKREEAALSYASTLAD